MVGMVFCTCKDTNMYIICIYNAYDFMATRHKNLTYICMYILEGLLLFLFQVTGAINFNDIMFNSQCHMLRMKNE